MGKLKFYRSKKNPTVQLDRTWAREADEIDTLLREHCGENATWSQIFAYGDVANRIYYLFKHGYKKFTFGKILFRHLHGDMYTVELGSDVVLEPRNPTT